MKKRVSKRANHVATASDMRKIRMSKFRNLCIILFPIFIYVFYGLSGLYKIGFEMVKAKEQLIWCMFHPVKIYNDNSLPMVLLGILLWGLVAFSYYNKLSYNLMHGQEYGTAKWGNIRKFNARFSNQEEPKANKIFSENIRFKYDSSTLRNNNTFVVGGSGAGKTSFFLTPNLLNLHGCNIYTDPKGTLVEELGPYLEAQPDTRVYTINMCEMNRSMHINPFLFIEKKSDISKLIQNLIQNTSSANIKNSSQDPFWERAERMFLESIFLYVWMECPKAVLIEETGEVRKLDCDWRSVLYLIDEAQFRDGDEPPKLDGRMQELAKKKPEHPAVKAYSRYRGGPDETVRSVLMTVNARMQPFDNDELLDIFSSNDVPLDQVGVGVDGDKKTKSNIFIVIPDDDDTYNFVPGMIYTLLFQKLYSQARIFGGKLPLDVGFWLDEFANTKMPSNFDKILATCRSRGIYCVPMLQSLAQIKTLFADGAWEGVVGNCDTFLYLGGNEASTFEYISKLLGKWTIDKKTNGESKGSSGSTSENYDVLGRELMNEYEVRMLPNDECILFVRGEEPLRDKKWFPWEHEEYNRAREYIKNKVSTAEELGNLGVLSEDSKLNEDSCIFINEDSLEYMKKQARNGENITIEGIDAYDFMMMDLDQLTGNGEGASEGVDLIHGDAIINLIKLQELQAAEKEALYEERRQAFLDGYDKMDLFSVYASEFISETRKKVIRELSTRKNKVEDKVILKIVDPRFSEEEMMKKKRMWEEMSK